MRRRSVKGLSHTVPETSRGNVCRDRGGSAMLHAARWLHKQPGCVTVRDYAAVSGLTLSGALNRLRGAAAEGLAVQTGRGVNATFERPDQCSRCSDELGSTVIRVEGLCVCAECAAAACGLDGTF